MPVIDDQGRIFGKVNIIDAAVLVVICLLIPLAYGAYLLFRVPPVQILAVEPARISPGTTEVMIRGQHFRPYLRMNVGDQPGTFFFGTPERALLRLPQLRPGTYDVVLYDERQELGRLTGGLVVEESSPSSPSFRYEEKVVSSTGELMAIGAFRGLDLTGARELARQMETLNQRAMPWGTIRGFQRPETNSQLTADFIPISDGAYQIRAVLRLRCVLMEDFCRIQDRPVRSGTAVAVEISGAPVRFFVEEVHPVYDSRIELRIRATVSAAVATLLRRDAIGTFPAHDALRPTYVSFDVVETTKDGTQTGFISLGLPAVKVRGAWYYGNRPLRLGDSFTLETPLYTVPGPIVSIRSIGQPQDAS